ncbi:MAG: tetratricopeptide repeat protein [Treponema sp.]|nr:tetratricopeptide repeat protein [Treponema sp.]
METTVSPGGSRSLSEPLSPDHAGLRMEYDQLFPRRALIVRELEARVKEALLPLASSPKVKGRVKSFESYIKKYIRHLKGGCVPSHIHDIIGIRIVCTFLEEIAGAEKLLKERFSVSEVERKGEAHTFREFGYESIHLLIAVPDDIAQAHGLACCETAEIQIRTIMQDAWAEVEHELIYKAEFTPFDTPLKRKLAAVNASLSLADIIFQEVRSYQRELNGELGKRRSSFFQKIEDSTDAILFSELSPPAGSAEAGDPADPARSQAAEPISATIDDLLLGALHAHNRSQFVEAISIYARILEMKPAQAVSALIYKHRGMAYFARSCYEEAISDFSQSLALDPKSYKAAYYQGIVYSVLGNYPQALDAFNAALQINPYQAYCLYRRGQAYYHLGDYPHALGDCEAALGLEPFEAARKFRELVLGKLKM